MRIDHQAYLFCDSYSSWTEVSLVQNVVCIKWAGNAMMKKHKYTYVLLRKDIISNVVLQMGSSCALLNFHNRKKKICKTLRQLGCRLLLQSLHTYFNQSHQTLTLPSSLAICCGYYLKAMFLI